MQVAVIEYARNVAGLKGANSTEFDRHAEHPVVGLITEWTDAGGITETRTESSDLGGTMRLGAQNCNLSPETLSRKAYGNDVITERHRHRYEVNNNYVEELQNAGLKVAGRSEDNALVEMIEVADHPWFVACQFHPEFTSTPRDGHGLFTAFINAAVTHSKQN